MTIKPGDTVYHGPTGESWTVAAVSPLSGYLSPVGWPETLAKIEDCELTHSCDDDTSRQVIRGWAKHSWSDWRVSINRQIVEQEDRAACEAMMRY